VEGRLLIAIINMMGMYQMTDFQRMAWRRSETTTTTTMLDTIIADPGIAFSMGLFPSQLPPTPRPPPPPPSITPLTIHQAPSSFQQKGNDKRMYRDMMVSSAHNMPMDDPSPSLKRALKPCRRPSSTTNTTASNLGTEDDDGDRKKESSRHSMAVSVSHHHRHSSSSRRHLDPPSPSRLPFPTYQDYHYELPSSPESIMDMEKDDNSFCHHHDDLKQMCYQLPESVYCSAFDCKGGIGEAGVNGITNIWESVGGCDIITTEAYIPAS